MKTTLCSPRRYLEIFLQLTDSTKADQIRAKMVADYDRRITYVTAK